MRASTRLQPGFGVQIEFSPCSGRQADGTIDSLHDRVLLTVQRALWLGRTLLRKILQSSSFACADVSPLENGQPIQNRPVSSFCWSDLIASIFGVSHPNLSKIQIA